MLILGQLEVYPMP